MSAERMDTALENQFTPILDAQGYVVGGSVTRERADGLGFLDVLRDASARFPFDPNDIVYGDEPVIVTEVRDASGTVIARMTTVDVPLSETLKYKPSEPRDRGRRTEK